MTPEAINYLMHFELSAIPGSLIFLIYIKAFLQMKPKDLPFFYLILASKLFVVNTYNVLVQLEVIDSFGHGVIIPISTLLFFLFTISYCMWKTNLSFLHVQLSMLLAEIICLFTLTTPTFLLNALLDPSWTIGMDTPFNWINAFVLWVSLSFSLLVYKLLSKPLKKYAQMQFKRPKIWYTLIFIYLFISIYGVVSLNIKNIWLCLLYQAILLSLGAAFILTINEMIKRREVRKLYLAHKYLLIENTLLKEYYQSIEIEVSRAQELCLELQKVRQELLSLSTQVRTDKELTSYIAEIETMLTQEIKNGEMLLKK